jgi:hypothetical protein
MTRLRPFFIAIVLMVAGCSHDKTIDEKTSLDMEDSSANRVVNPEVTTSTVPNGVLDSHQYKAVNGDELSLNDSETAYEMCVHALTDYYKAVWNGSDIKLNEFITNENLKQYTQKKIQSQHALHGDLSKVKMIEIDNWEVAYTDDAEGGFLYLEIPVHIHKFIGAYGEATEFLVRNINGKLVIVDWYTGAKDSYDFMERGENLTIDNPAVWDDSEWAEKLNSTTD